MIADHLALELTAVLWVLTGPAIDEPLLERLEHGGQLLEGFAGLLAELEERIEAVLDELEDELAEHLRKIDCAPGVLADPAQRHGRGSHS